MSAKEIEVIAACTSFQYAAGIPPGQIQFDKGFARQDEDMHGNSGLERSLLHMAYNNDAMEILDTPVGRAILEYKWRTYGKQAYLKSMIWPVLLILFTTLESIAWYMASYHWWAGSLPSISWRCHDCDYMCVDIHMALPPPPPPINVLNVVVQS